MSKLRNIEFGKYYHNYSRGINRCNIFLDESDYLIFMKMIEINNCPGHPGQGELVEIFCYTLMPNHFHFILKEVQHRGISLFFQKVLSQYVGYFNKKYNRRGPLFESRFKDKPIDVDQYFEHLVEYIWNNPIKLIRPDYASKDLLNEIITLDKTEKEFARNYKYKFFALGALGKRT